MAEASVGRIERVVRGTVPPGAVVEVRMPDDVRPLLEFGVPAWSGPAVLECWVEEPRLALPAPDPKGQEEPDGQGTEAGAEAGADTAVEAGAGNGAGP